MRPKEEGMRSINAQVAAAFRRAAAGSGGGVLTATTGRTAPETPTRGGRYLKHRPPPGLCEPLDEALAAQIAVKD